MAAADEIARQLRLRDIGGIIIIDFIDMHSNENKQKLYDKMKEAMSRDRTKHNLLPLSKYGLMQITRQRVRPIMDVNEECPSCKGSGKVSPSVRFTDELQNKLDFFSKREGLSTITLKIHPFIAGYLTKGLWSIRLQWSIKFRCWVQIQAIPSLAFLEYHFHDKNNKELKSD